MRPSRTAGGASSDADVLGCWVVRYALLLSWCRVGRIRWCQIARTDALASAYENNADFNAARAQLRGIDENVPQALAGYRPTISADADAAANRTRLPGAPDGVQLLSARG